MNESEIFVYSCAYQVNEKKTKSDEPKERILSVISRMTFARNLASTATHVAPQISIQYSFFKTKIK